MSQEPKDHRPEPKPRRLAIPGFLSEEIGLGDAVARLTRTLGIQPCAGCRRRAAALNRRVTLMSRR